MAWNDWFIERKRNKQYIQRIRDEIDDVRCIDLPNINILINPTRFGLFTATGEVGLFTSDMFHIDIPHLTWHVDRAGRIDSYWEVRLPYKSDEWIKEIKRGANSSTSDINIGVPMSKSTVDELQELTNELWTMHKLTSDKLLL